MGMWWPGVVVEGEVEIEMGRFRMMGRRRVRAGRLVGGLRVVRVVPATRRGVPSSGDLTLVNDLLLLDVSGEGNSR